MITSLRNGLADGLIATRQHRVVTAVRYRPRNIHLSARAPDGLSWQFSGSIALHSLGCRFVSTTPPPPTGSPSKEILRAAPNSAPRKHKVDLRPGPVKPPKESLETSPTSELAVSSSSTSEPTSSASPTETPAHPNSSIVPPGHGVIETAKEDFNDASKHGILTPPPENASWAGKIFHQAKELFKFYWNGVKLINTNRKRAWAMQARVQAGGPPLSRWETRFIANYKMDALKLIPFALIVIIAEEVIPLVVIYVPFLLPSTCLLPSQKERIDNKRREKQQTYADNMKLVFQTVHRRALEHPELTADQLLDRTAVISYNGVFSLSTFGIPPVRLRRLKRHLDAVAADDALLARENWGERLTSTELREALEERGIVTQNLSTEIMRARLRWWLTGISQTDSDLTRRRILLVAANAIGKHE